MFFGTLKSNIDQDQRTSHSKIPLNVRIWKFLLNVLLP